MRTVQITGPVSLLAGGTLLLAFWQPNHFSPWVSFYNEFLAFVALLLLGLHALLSGNRYKLSPLGVALLALALVPWLQYWAGLIVYSGDALIASLYLSAAGAAVLLGRSYVSTRDPITMLAALLLIAALVSVVLALVQWLGIDSSIWLSDLNPARRPGANLAQSNHLATLLCMGLAGLLYLWERRLLSWQTSSFMGVLLLFGLALTQSRTSWIVSLGFTGWCLWHYRAGNLRLAPVYPLLWLGLYIGFIVLLSYVAEALHFVVEDVMTRAQQTERLDEWQQMWYAVTQGDLWGYGWTQVATAQLAVALEYPTGLPLNHSHNIVLDLLIWNGPLLGSVIVLLLIGWLLRLYLRAASVESIFCLMAVGAVLVHGLLEYPLEFAYFLLPISVLLGLAESGQNAPVLGTAPRWTAAPALMAGILATFLVWAEYRFIEEDFRQMRFEVAGFRPGAAIEESPWQLPLFNQFRAYIRFARNGAHEGMSDVEISRMRKVSTHFPTPPSLMRYGLALALNDRPKEARELFLRLRGVHGDGHYQEAKASLIKMREVYPQLNALELP